MSKDKERRITPKQAIGRLQDMIGRMKNLYMNDRNKNTADQLLPLFDEAFELCIKVRGRWKP